MTPPQQPIPSNQPAWIQGWLGVLAAVLTPIITLVGGYLLGAGLPEGRPSISIDGPTGALRSIKALDDFAGSVKNIQKGQLVWLFNQQLERTDDPKAEPSAIFATTGPCIVAEDRWVCNRVGVGGPATSANAPGKYRVWAAVVDEKTAFELVEDLRHHGGQIPDRAEPPNVGALDSAIVKRE